MSHIEKQQLVTHVATLAQRAQAGSRDAFEQLVNLYQGDIFRMVYYRTRSRMDAEDLTQDIFMRAFRNISKLKSADRFRGWLFSIAVNRVRDFCRKQRFRAFFSSSFEEEDRVEPDEERKFQQDALNSLMKKDFWKQIEAFQQNLSPAAKEVFMLRFMDGLSIREISQAMEKSESTVKTHLYRSLQKFKKENTLRHFLQESLT